MWIKLQDDLYNLDNTVGIYKSDFSYADQDPIFYIKFYCIRGDFSVSYSSKEDRDRDYDYIISFLSSKGVFRDMDAWNK